MRSLEQKERGESFETTLGGIARAYGFSAPPVIISKRKADAEASEYAEEAGAVAALTNTIKDAEETTQSWGVSRSGKGSVVLFAIASPRHAIAQAFVVQAALATAESAGFENPTVLISSVGDTESNRRFARELGNFFKKHAKSIPEDILELSVKEPEKAARELIARDEELAELLPRTIDYLSESSRKTMLETISLFESLNISYELAPRLPYETETRSELVFAIDGTDRKGNRVRVATGGRFDEGTKKKGDPQGEVIGIGVSVPSRVNAKAVADERTPVCFVIHVGEAARLKSFTMLEPLLTARIALAHALLAKTIQEQMELAQASGARYVTVIGQREALDNTVIIRNLSNQIQETIPLERLVPRLARVRA